jgi:CheY-like chemotaxis protein
MKIMVTSLAAAKVMIVDDRTEFRDLVAEILLPMRIQVCGCEDGEEVLELYRREEPQWVVMDFRMRKVDGITATRELLRHFPEARVILVSGHDPAPLEVAAREAGARHFLSKEFLGQLPALLV